MTDIELLYDAFFSKVYAYAVSISKNKAVAEDITSETFYRAIKNYKKIDDSKNVNSWLCEIAKNIYLDMLRKSKTVPIDDFEFSDNDDFQSKLDDSDSSKQVHKILHTLDEPYKEIFSLRVFGELSFADIGELFEKSESWARVTFFRAKKKIQTKLSENKREEI